MISDPQRIIQLDYVLPDRSIFIDEAVEISIKFLHSSETIFYFNSPIITLIFCGYIRFKCDWIINNGDKPRLLYSNVSFSLYFIFCRLRRSVIDSFTIIYVFFV